MGSATRPHISNCVQPCFIPVLFSLFLFVLFDHRPMILIRFLIEGNENEEDFGPPEYNALVSHQAPPVAPDPPIPRSPDPLCPCFPSTLNLEPCVLNPEP